MTELVRPQKRLLTIKNAAIYLDRGIHGVRNLIWTGQIPAVKDPGGRKLFIDIKDLEAYVDRNKSQREAI